MRGAYWAYTTPVLSPFDEAQHLGYVHAIATGEGIPIVGEDLLPLAVIELAKSSPTGPYRSAPLRLDPQGWGPFGHQYEAHQGPVYYALLAPFHALAEGRGHVAVLYTLRFVTVVLALLAIPVAWLLAREVLPSRPSAWLAAPAVLVLVQGFNANTAAVNNDALLVPVAGAVLVPVARSLRAGFTLRRGATAGALAGLALLTKATAAGAVAAAGVGVLVWLALGRARPRQVGRWLLTAGTATLLVVLPWVVWHLLVYGTDPASERVYRLLTETTQPPLGFNFEAFRTHLSRSVGGFWESHLVPRTLPDRQAWLWFGIALGATIAAVAVAARCRDRGERFGEAYRSAWTAAAFVPVLAAHLVVVYVAAHGGAITSGRLLYAALVPTVVGLTTTAFLVLRVRVAVAVLAVLAAVSLWDATRLVERHIDATYTGGGAPGEAPVVAQTWNDGWVEDVTFTVDAPCPQPVFVLFVEGDAPQVLTLHTGEHAVRVRLDGATPLAVGVTRARYEPTSVPGGPVLVDLPTGVAIGHSAVDRSSSLTLEGRQGDPTISVLCPVEAARARRFHQSFTPLRPGAPPLTLVREWGTGWAAALTVLAALAVTAAVGKRFHGRSYPGNALAPRRDEER